MANAKLMESAVLTKQIARLSIRTVAYRAVVQSLAVEAIGHCVSHGNINPCVALAAAVDKHHKPAIVSFLTKEGNVRWDKEAKELKFNPRFDRDSFTEQRKTELLKGKVWTDYVKAPEVKDAFDCADVLKRTIESYERAVKAGKKIAHSDLMDGIRALYYGFEARQYETVPTADRPDAIASAKAKIEQELKAAELKAAELKAAEQPPVPPTMPAQPSLIHLLV